MNRAHRSQIALQSDKQMQIQGMTSKKLKEQHCTISMQNNWALLCLLFKNLKERVSTQRRTVLTTAGMVEKLKA